MPTTFHVVTQPGIARPELFHIEKLVDANYQHVAIHTALKRLDAQTQLALDARASTWWETHYPGYSIESGGTSLVFAKLGHTNASSMVIALLVALLVISIACAIIIGSLHGVWIGMMCNLLPIIYVYAVWALLDGNLSIGGAVCVAPD